MFLYPLSVHADGPTVLAEANIVETPADYLPEDINYARVAHDYPVYTTRSQVREDDPDGRLGSEENQIWVDVTGEDIIAGNHYYHIEWDHAMSGWILTEAVEFRETFSQLQGIWLEDFSAEEMGIVYQEDTDVYRRMPASGDKPQNAESLGVAQRYAPITIEEKQTIHDEYWYRIRSDKWVNARNVRRISPAKRPDAVGLAEQWIEVDISEQTVIAHEGDTPVFATLTSTGRSGHETITGLFRPWLKLRTTPMRGYRFGLEYNLAAVPWTYFFEGDFAWHATYWHDDFGARRSAGCVNLSPHDARWLFDWSYPDLPANATAVEPDAENPGTWVYVRE